MGWFPPTVRIISIQSFANVGSYNITTLPLLMPVVYQEVVFGWEEEKGRKERRKVKEFPVDRVGIRMELQQK